MKDFYSRWYLHLHLCNTDWMRFILHSNASRGTVLHYQYYYFKCILFVCTKFMFIRKEFIAKTSHICICIFRIHRFTRHCHDHRISFQCSFVLVFVFYVHLRINIQDHFHLFVFLHFKSDFNIHTDDGSDSQKTWKNQQQLIHFQF